MSIRWLDVEWAGWGMLGERLLGCLARWLAVPAGAAVATVAVGVVAHRLAPAAWVAAIVAWGAGDWLVRRFLAPDIERRTLRLAWAPGATGMLVVWFWGGSPQSVVEVVAGLVGVFAVLWLVYGVQVRRAGEATVPAADPGEEPPAEIARLMANWRWHSERLGLRRSSLRYGGCDGGEDHLVLSLAAGHRAPQPRGLAERLDVVLEARSGTCRVELDADRADRCHLYVRPPERETARIEALLAEPMAAIPASPTPDERLAAVFESAPGGELDYGEVVERMRGVMSQATITRRLRSSYQQVRRGRWRRAG